MKPKPKVTHKMTVDQFMSSEYNMRHRCRGKAIIVNNVVFKKEFDHQAREGSFRDTAKIREIFEELRFEPVKRRVSRLENLVYTDLTVPQIQELVRDGKIFVMRTLVLQ